MKCLELIANDKLATAWLDGAPTTEGTAIYDKPKDQGGKRIGTIIGGKRFAAL